MFVFRLTAEFIYALAGAGKVHVLLEISSN